MEAFCPHTPMEAFCPHTPMEAFCPHTPFHRRGCVKNKTKRNLKETCHIIVMGLFYGDGYGLSVPIERGMG